MFPPAEVICPFLPFILIWNSPNWLSNSLSNRHMFCMGEKIDTQLLTLVNPGTFLLLPQQVFFLPETPAILTHFRVLLVALAGFGQALSGLLAARGTGCVGLDHVVSAISESSLDAIRLIELIDLSKRNQGERE